MNSGCLGTHCVDEAGPELSSASLTVCILTAEIKGQAQLC